MKIYIVVDDTGHYIKKVTLRDGEANPSEYESATWLEIESDGDYTRKMHNGSAWVNVTLSAAVE